MAVIVALALASALPAAAGCLKCKVKGFVAAHRNGDLEKASGYLADDFTFRVKGDDAVVDREWYLDVLAWDAAVVDREWYLDVLAWDAAAGCEVSYDELIWEGDVVTAVFTETNEVYRQLGVEPRRYRLTITFESDLMREQVLEPLPSEGPDLDEALRPFLAWASEHRRDDLARVYRNGRPVYDGGSAATWITLLEDWSSTR